MSVPFQVIPYEKLEYKEDPFMNIVDQLNLESDTGPNIYLCFFSLEKGKYGGDYTPRESVFSKFLTSDKKQFKYSTDERDIKIDGKSIYYFLMLLSYRNIFLKDFSTSKRIDDGNSAKSKYGKIYDDILMSCSKNKCFIIYAQDIDSADKLFKDAVKNRTITLENITKVVENKQRRLDIDRDIKIKKQKEEEIAEERKIEEGKERSKIIQDKIASIPPTVDLRWQVFRLHDIGDTIVSENKVLPKFSIPVSECDPINISDSSKVIPSTDTVDIPQDFSWVKKVNDSNSIHVISVKRYHPYTIDEYEKYTIILKGERYQVTIKELGLNGPPHSDDELEFKKRMILPFIDESNYLVDKYFVLNAEDETGVLCYFLRKYGICNVESPDENKYTFGFMKTPTILSFDINSLFDAIPFVLRCLKNDKLLMKQIDNGPSTPTPEVLVLSQLTKEKIKNATSVYFVVEKKTTHRKRGGVQYFGEIDGFTGPVIMHETQWSLGCVQSILDESKCTNYNELTLLACKTPYGIAAYTEYLTSGKFPKEFSLVIRGSDDYCKFVALEPYGNVFDKNWIECKKYDQCFDWVILRPGLGQEDKQHPVFYIFNAANKASAVNAFNAKLQEELKNVISVEDGKNVVNKTNLDNNLFLKTFKSYNKATGALYYEDSITPFVKSIITDETPKTDVLIPENIELETVESEYVSDWDGSDAFMDRYVRGEVQSSSSSSSPQRVTPTYRTVYTPAKQDYGLFSNNGSGFGNRLGFGGKSNKKRTKKSRRNKVRSNKRNARSNKRATRSNKRKYNNTRKK